MAEFSIEYDREWCGDGFQWCGLWQVVCYCGGKCCFDFAAGEVGFVIQFNNGVITHLVG